MKKISIFLSSIWFFALGLGANPLDLQKVSKDANWFAHFDFSAMRKSEVGTFIRTSIEEIPEVMDRINRMKQDHGVDLDGFSHLTLSGSGERDSAIAILKGGVDMKKIFENLKSQVSSFDNSQTHGNNNFPDDVLVSVSYFGGVNWCQGVETFAISLRKRNHYGSEQLNQ